ncbi:MAG: type I methionyl aminopeptidase [bacterium]
MAAISIKSKDDIEAMRRSCRVVSEIRDRLAAMLAPGMTTGEVDHLAVEMMREYGAKSAFLNYRGFPGNICISVNEEVVHGIGGERKLAYGDAVKLDVGIFLNGWVGDTAVSVAIGVVPEEVEKLMRATEEALHIGIAKARSGARLGDVSAAIERHAVSHGYSVVREFVGHGVGRKLHEEPQIPNYGRAGTGPILKPGMTLAIEPMVNMGVAEVKLLKDGWTVVTADEKPSAHYEHTILVTEKDPEILTTCSSSVGVGAKGALCS